MISFLKVDESETISTVKNIVAERLKIPPPQQRLIYKGKTLTGKLFRHCKGFDLMVEKQVDTFMYDGVISVFATCLPKNILVAASCKPDKRPA